MKERMVIARVGMAVIAVAMTSGFIFPKKYEQPEAEKPAAALALVKPPSEVDNPSPMAPTRYFNAYDNPSCEEGSRGGFLGTLSHPVGGLIGNLMKSDRDNRKEFRVAVDEPLYLKVKAQVVTDSRRRAFKSLVCTNMVTFTPLNGHRYEAKQIATSDRCVLLVIDEETKRAPDDFAMVPIAGACHDD